MASTIFSSAKVNNILARTNIYFTQYGKNLNNLFYKRKFKKICNEGNKDALLKYECPKHILFQQQKEGQLGPMFLKVV